jgi:hypothetical protein
MEHMNKVFRHCSDDLQYTLMLPVCYISIMTCIYATALIALVKLLACLCKANWTEYKRVERDCKSVSETKKREMQRERDWCYKMVNVC